MIPFCRSCCIRLHLCFRSHVSLLCYRHLQLFPFCLLFVLLCCFPSPSFMLVFVVLLRCLCHRRLCCAVDRISSANRENHRPRHKTSDCKIRVPRNSVQNLTCLFTRTCPDAAQWRFTQPRLHVTRSVGPTFRSSAWNSIVLPIATIRCQFRRKSRVQDPSRDHSGWRSDKNCTTTRRSTSRHSCRSFCRGQRRTWRIRSHCDK